MNMRDLGIWGDLHHEYKKGCIFKVTFLATFLGGLIFICCMSLSEAHMKWLAAAELRLDFRRPLNYENEKKSQNDGAKL